jgi:fructose-specific phosphotransferase system IIC component
MSDYYDSNGAHENDEGSKGAGIALGLILGFIGVVIAYAIGKKETLKGAWIGVLINIGADFVGAIFIIVLLSSSR